MSCGERVCALGGTPCRIGDPCCTRRLLPLRSTRGVRGAPQRHVARLRLRSRGATCAGQCCGTERGGERSEKAACTHRPTTLPSTTKTAPTGMPPSNMPLRACTQACRQARVRTNWRGPSCMCLPPRRAAAHGRSSRTFRAERPVQRRVAHLLDGLLQELPVIRRWLRYRLAVPLWVARVTGAARRNEAHADAPSRTACVGTRYAFARTVGRKRGHLISRSEECIFIVFGCTVCPVSIYSSDPPLKQCRWCAKCAWSARGLPP